MIAPGVAAGRFGISFLLGAALGAYYAFLRPLRPGHKTLSDLLFLPGAVWAFAYLGFAVCGGDLRMGYGVGMLCGAVACVMSLGRLLAPLFSLFWRCIAAPWKKISRFRKKMFASAKKWFTIEQNEAVKKQISRRYRKKETCEREPSGFSFAFKSRRSGRNV